MIYARVSQDRAAGRSVVEQEQECRAVCQREGWTVADVLIDNDAGASRWSRSKRPSYDRLSSILREGDVLVTWEASRAQRDLRAYLTLRDLCAERGVLWCYSGRVFDLTRSDDRFMTLLDIGLAEKEVDQTRERILRNIKANVEAGKPHGVLPYGYRIERDPETGKSIRRVLHPDQAPVVRRIADAVLDGQSLNSIARQLNSEGILTKTGKRWEGKIIGRIIGKPAYAGLRVHKGKVVSQGTWPAILTEDEHARIVAILTAPDRRQQRGTDPRALLSGIAVCGKCEQPTYRARNHGRWVYQCKKGCVARRIEDADEAVIEYMLTALSDPRVSQRLSETDDSLALEARNEMEAIHARMDEFAREAARVDSTISPRSFATMEAEWHKRLAELEEIATVGMISPQLAKLAQDPVGVWESMDLEERRAAVQAAVSITLNQVRSGLKVIDVRWRTA